MHAHSSSVVSQGRDETIADNLNVSTSPAEPRQASCPKGSYYEEHHLHSATLPLSPHVPLPPHVPTDTPPILPPSHHRFTSEWSRSLGLDLPMTPQMTVQPSFEKNGALRLAYPHLPKTSATVSSFLRRCFTARPTAQEINNHPSNILPPGRKADTPIQHPTSPRRLVVKVSPHPARLLRPSPLQHRPPTAREKPCNCFFPCAMLRRRPRTRRRRRHDPVNANPPRMLPRP